MITSAVHPAPSHKDTEEVHCGEVHEGTDLDSTVTHYNSSHGLENSARRLSSRDVNDFKMIGLYVVTALFIVGMIWLGVHRRWKALLGLVVGLVLIIAVCWYFFLALVRSECNDLRVWEIENYMIVEKQCIGFAGPSYYPVFLYENNKEIDRIVYMGDSTCVVKFRSKQGDTLSFDICEMKLEKFD